MATVVSPLLCDPDRPHAPLYARNPDTDYGRRSREVEAHGARDAAGKRARCQDCGRSIRRREYVEREGGPRGEKCGGRIGHPRTPAKPPAARKPTGDVDEGQLELFFVVRVPAAK